MLSQDKRNIVIVLLLVLAFLSLKDHKVVLLAWILAGGVLAGLFDYLVNRLVKKKNFFPKSAIISGLIIAGILSYQLEFWWLALFIILAIASKHLIKLNGKHFFNPANFGLFFATLLGFPLIWPIESNIYLIILVGLYLAYSFRKLTHVLGFLISFGLLFYFFSAVNPLNLVSWFFIFIMLIEPKTSGFGNLRGLTFGAIAGLAALLFYKYLPQIDLFVGALFVANLFNPLLEKVRG